MSFYPNNSDIFFRVEIAFCHQVIKFLNILWKYLVICMKPMCKCELMFLVGFSSCWSSCVWLKNIVNVSAYPQVFLGSHLLLGTSSVIPTHEYFGHLWGISRELITVLYISLISTTHSFLVGLPDLLNQVYNFS